jgi:energy-coupling factor transporter ATP-binding protein EcfA2
LKFVTSVKIHDFRSIARGEVADLTDIVPLVGVNGSGKSNFLRALNLLFTDRVEGNDALDLRRDFREPGRKAKLRVVIEADLDYGVFDALRDEYREALDRLAEGSQAVTLQKEWALHPVTKEQVVTLSAGAVGEPIVPLTPDVVTYATRLLSVIRFRYIPNHVHPSAILRAEEANIRNLLFARLGQSGVLSTRAVAQIANEAAGMMAPIESALKRATGEVGAVELATPKDFRELAWMFGLRLQASQPQAFEALLHGSGVQSVLAYQILHMLDTTFLRSFGWRKGAVWAIEEPESFLHANLQGELEKAFADYASAQPLQIFVTTHLSAFLGAAEEGVTVELDDTGRSAFAKRARRDTIRVAYTSGASAFAHPLHTGPPRPLLLVEGQSDRDLINRAYRVSKLGSPYEVLCLNDFDPTMAGGDQVASWLKYHRGALEARPLSSPVMVLLDWEATDATIQKIDKAVRVHASSRCIRWPSDLCNRDLSESWIGIERFLSTRFVEFMRDRRRLPLLLPARPSAVSWKYTIEKKELLNAKPRMHAELARRRRRADIEPLIRALPWLSQQLKDAPTML